MKAIYQIELLKDGRSYIGSAVNVERRQREHIRHLTRGSHHNGRLQNAWNKYGASSFAFSILEEVAAACDLVSVEQCYIDRLQPAFNISPKAGSQLGYRHTTEERERARLRMVGVKLRQGKPFSQEARDRLSEQRRAKGHSQAQREHLLRMQENNRRTRIAKPKPPAKPRYSGKGRVVSLETRKKISAAQMGNKSRTGLKHTTETREKIAERITEWWKERKAQQSGSEPTK
jgi:group I intron endonuclease